jgi:hypothetical protein
MHFERERFVRLTDHGGRVVRGISLKRCVFEGCIFSGTKYVEERSRAVDLVIEDCKAINCAVQGGVVEECVVTNLQSNTRLICWGTVFRHVILRGRMGNFMISEVGASSAAGEDQKRFEEANKAYYATVDWALDIREAEFDDADLRGVPTQLVRRDPETQMILTREKLLSGSWRRVDLVDRLLPGMIEAFMLSGDPSVLFIAGKRSKSFKSMLSGLQNLRAAGLAT